MLELEVRAVQVVQVVRVGLGAMQGHRGILVLQEILALQEITVAVLLVLRVLVGLVVGLRVDI
jgi:hypothetical protein